MRDTPMWPERVYDENGVEITTLWKRARRDFLFLGDRNLADIQLLFGRTFLLRDTLNKSQLQFVRRHAQREGIAALNRMIANLAVGEGADPEIRKLLADVLMSGEFQLVPKRPRRGRWSKPLKEFLALCVLQYEMQAGRTDVAYRKVETQFGLKRRRVLKIAKNARAKGAHLNRE